MTCTSFAHHHACACREEVFKRLLESIKAYLLCEQDCFDTSDGHGYEMKEILKKEIAQAEESLK